MFTKAKQEIESWPQKTQRLVNNVKNELVRATKGDGNFDLHVKSKVDGDPLWLT
jgi:hypothetical protein